ncbi:DUF3097 family protein [Egibacter rhizosphaerae]|uniref:DUF3097 family protein n=1 Tax=Egibacter rhizosphaerae TaxID=1670831 RepID=UPI00197A8C80
MPGTIVEDRASGFSGEIVRLERGSVVLRDWRDRERAFPLRGGRFLVEDQPATLVRRPDPAERPADQRHETASGALVGRSQQARVASPHRIYVEGLHDAELLEKVWGEELREAAVVVEPIGGADEAPEAVRRFGPAHDRRLGVLLDHLVAGSKETRIAERITGAHVLVTGHPYVDVWQGVRPRAVGLRAWPEVPKGQDWKTGICRALGEEEPAALWRRLLRAVDSIADLEPSLVGAVERLLDFLIEPLEH